MSKREAARLAMMAAVEGALAQADELENWYINHSDEFQVYLHLDCLKNEKNQITNHPIIKHTRQRA